MAPSPELGQPKAPDKGNTSKAVNDGSPDSGAHSEPINSQKTATTNTQQDTENLDSWDDRQLKALLDEAITYKTPKDREHKSQAFKELLQTAELEDQAREFNFNRLSSRAQRASGRHTQGGSLQDLAEAVHNESLLDVDFCVMGHTKKHHNSRQKKYSSSVSSRQREGGSLPSNVNGSNLYSQHDQPFLNEVVSNKRRGGKNEAIVPVTPSTSAALAGCNPSSLDTVIKDRVGGSSGGAGSCGSGADGASGPGTIGGIIAAAAAAVVASANVVGGINTDAESPMDVARKFCHTIIDMGNIDSDETQHLLAHDSLAQGLSDPLSGDEGIELNSIKIPRPNYTTHAKLEIRDRTSAHSVDKTIPFPLMDNQAVETTPLQLNSQYTAVTSVVDNKNDMTRTSNIMSNGKYLSCFTGPSPQTREKLLDENGNSVSSYNTGASTSNQTGKNKSKKPSKADRNVVILNQKELNGYCGDEAIETLLLFIENKESTRKNGAVLNKAGNNNRNNNSNNNSVLSGGGGAGTSGSSGSNSRNNKKDKKNNNSSSSTSGGKKDNHSNNKLKKSNSMDELSSCSKLEDITRSENHSNHESGGVTLRTKNNNSKKLQNEQISGGGGTGGGNQKSNNAGSQQQQSQHKRGERRSWGTEELSYLGESSSQNTSSCNNNGDSGNKKIDSKNGKSVCASKESKDNNHGPNINSSNNNNNNNNNNNAGLANCNLSGIAGGSSMKKKEEHLLSIVSIESISTSSETAEFHVVTKKKKPKKRQNIGVTSFDTNDNNRPNNNNNNNTGNTNKHNFINSGNRNNNINNHHHNHNHDQINHHGNNNGGGSSSASIGAANRSKSTFNHQTSSHFTNDRDLYINSLNVSDNNRRKSTSSVPPSEKSDSSDLDSVHSLPVESSSTRLLLTTTTHQQQSTSNGSTPQASYADIARIANSGNNNIGGSAGNGGNGDRSWPAMPRSSNYNSNIDTLETASTNSGSTTASNKSQTSVVNKATNKEQQKVSTSFPDLNENNDQYHTHHSQQQHHQHHHITSNTNSNHNSSTATNTTTNGGHHKMLSGNNGIKTQTPNTMTYSKSVTTAPILDDINEVLMNGDTKNSKLINSQKNSDIIKVSPSMAPTQSNSSVSSFSSTSSSSSSSASSSSMPATNQDIITKNILQKSKSVDNDSYYNSIEQYPALEKTVKHQKSVQQQLVMVTSNNNQQLLVNKQASVKNYQSIPKIVDTKKTKPQQQQQQQQSTSVNSNNSSNSNVNINVNNNFNENINNNNNNNNNNINNATNVAVKPIIDGLKSPSLVSNVTKMSSPPPDQQQQPQQLTSSIVTAIIEPVNMKSNEKPFKPTKKDRSSCNINNDDSVCLNNTKNLTNCNVHHHHHNHHNRPAVIILNDNDRSQLNEGITFGFDINDQLLFGDFNEDEMHLLETSPTSSTILPPSPPSPPAMSSVAIASTSTATALQLPTSPPTASLVNDLSLRSDAGYSSSMSAVTTKNRSISSNYDGFSTLDNTISSTNNSICSQKSHENLLLIDNTAELCYNQQLQPLQKPKETKNCVSVQTSLDNLISIDNNTNLLNNNNISNRNRCEEWDDSAALVSSTLSASSLSSSTSTAVDMMATTTTTATTNQQQQQNPTINIKQINVRYVAPTGDLSINAYNHDKIVNFVGLAWEDIVCDTNSGAQYYNGQ